MTKWRSSSLDVRRPSYHPLKLIAICTTPENTAFLSTLPAKINVFLQIKLYEHKSPRLSFVSYLREDRIQKENFSFPSNNQAIYKLVLYIVLNERPLASG